MTNGICERENRDRDGHFQLLRDSSAGDETPKGREVVTCCAENAAIQRVIAGSKRFLRRLRSLPHVQKNHNFPFQIALVLFLDTIDINKKIQDIVIIICADPDINQQ